MSDQLTPVEALQREINGVRSLLAGWVRGAETYPAMYASLIRSAEVAIAALELAKADASRHLRQGYRDECDQEMNDARAKLYKELQR